MGTLRQALGRPRRSEPFHAPITKPKPMDRQLLPWWWHPDRIGVASAPEWFATQLAAISPDLACTQYGIDGTWIIWTRDPKVQHPLCPGWSLLFLWRDPDTKQPLPLDARVIYNIYRRDMRRYPNAVAYFDQAETALKEAAATRERDAANDVESRRKDFVEGMRIKNIGAGNKAALHHDGTVVPSRGHLAMLAERKT